MCKKITTVEIHNKICHIYKNENNSSNRNSQLCIFYWGVGDESEKSVSAVTSYLEQHLKEQMPDAGFLLVAYESENWNDDFSPWKAQAVFGNEDFGGNANKTLEWLTNKCIPYIETENAAYIKDAKEVHRFAVGYSLAGLFCLWVYSECSLFSGAVSCSGSLWYKGWMEYVEEHRAAFYKNRISYIYLSLGDKEEKTKNRLMSTVGDNTRKMYTLLCEEQEDIKSTLEWNAGGHFSEPDIRVAKGIYWILKNFVV